MPRVPIGGQVNDRALRTETQLLAEIRAAVCARPDVLLWRNNTGVARHRDRAVTYGLGVGSPDLIGMVLIKDGSGCARFFALEVKLPGSVVRREQRLWIDAVNRAGGAARVVRSVDEALAALESAREGLRFLAIE